MVQKAKYRRLHSSQHACIVGSTPVGDGDNGAVLELLPHSLLDQRISLHIHIGCRLIQNQNLHNVACSDLEQKDCLPCIFRPWPTHPTAVCRGASMLGMKSSTDCMFRSPDRLQHAVLVTYGADAFRNGAGMF